MKQKGGNKMYLIGPIKFYENLFFFLVFKHGIRSLKLNFFRSTGDDP